MKTKLLALFIAAFALFFFQFFNFTSAQEGITVEEQKVIFPVPERKANLFGQDHKYTVHFRGNGEAVVTARFAFTNTADSEQNSFVLIGDNLEISNLVAYQIIKEPECIRFLPLGTCAQYGPVDYNYFWGARYEDAAVDYDGEKLAVTLPNPVGPDATGAVFLYFRSFEFTDKEFLGGFEYEFETLTSKEPIQNVSVGINVDSDIYLKRAESGVNYALPEMASLAVTDQALRSGQLDNLVNSVGYGQITKTASNLAPDESFEVAGEYAGSLVALYDGEIVIVLAVLVVVGLLMFVLSKKLASRTKDKNPLLLSIGLSTASSLILTLLTIGLYLAGSRSYYPFYEFGALLIFVYLFAFIFYISVFFAPVIYMGIKHGVGWGLTTLFMNIVILGVMMFAAVLILFSSSRRGNGPIPLEVSRGVTTDPQIMELESGVEEDVADY